MLEIKAATDKHFEDIVALNEVEVEYTSPMDRERIEYLHSVSSNHWVVESNQGVVGFLLVMDHESKYKNDNYAWFQALYDQFLYIDRIVIAKDYFGQRLGSRLYQRLISEARSRGIDNLVCEYNSEPMNWASKKFHDSFGFVAVGEQTSSTGKKTSMQHLDLRVT